MCYGFGVCYNVKRSQVLCRKRKGLQKKRVDDKEMAEIRAHNKIIDDKEKLLKIKHHKMWEEKKKNRRGFNEE